MRQAPSTAIGSDAFFRALIENASDIVAVLDAEGRRLYVSPSVQRILGYTPEKMLGLSAFEFTHPDDLTAVQRVYADLLKRPGGTDDLIFRYRHSNGNWHTMSSTVWNMLHDDSVRGIIVNSRDITDHVSLETQLRHAQKMEAVGQLAGGIAHDFNNLLTVIRGRTELMLAELDPTRSLHVDVSEISRAAARAAELTQQLLAFSRKQVLAPTPLELNALIANLAPMLDRLIGDDVEIVTRLAPRPLHVMADPGQIEQVLMNLAVNARDAMPDGGMVVISTSEHSPDAEGAPSSFPASRGSHVAIQLSDTGEGMNSGTLARVFEPFFTTKPAGKGTGLGLSTAYGIVAQSGGQMAAESAPGRGTTFTISLPLLAAEASDQPVRGRADSPAVGDGRGLDQILVVEDDEQVRRVTRLILERRGYRVLDASSGAQALEILGRSPDIRLVLSDAVMPEMTGQVLAARIRDLRPALPFLLMSGYTAEEISRRAGGATDELLHKPFTADGLTHAVRLKLSQPIAA